MKIDIKKAQKEFLKYVEKYDIKDSAIKLKRDHSIRVMQKARQIAQSMKLSEEEIDLATIIGLLHDIARFEQYVRFKNYVVISDFDHGDYAVEILEKDIRKYIETDEYDNIIKTAIRNHNKYKIEDGLNEKELFFSKLIRDADKLEIFYECVEIFWKGKEEVINNSKLSQEMYNTFIQNQMIIIEKDRNYDTIDDMLITLAYAFDINFKESYEILQKQDYINKTINRFNFRDAKTKEQMKTLIENLNNYINTHAKRETDIER